MSATILVRSLPDRYSQSVDTGRHQLLADEPESVGGADLTNKRFVIFLSSNSDSLIQQIRTKVRSAEVQNSVVALLLQGEVESFELARARRVELDEAALAPILDAFERAARLDPESPEPEFGRGFALETAGNRDAARAAYRSALERDPEHVGSLLNLAASLADAGDAAEARVLARRVLALGRGLAPAERHRLEEFVAGR